MDIQRPDMSKARRKRRIITGAIVGCVLIGITVALSRLKPAAPSVERNLLYIDTVKRGPMVRQERGLGTLVPEEIRWLAARTSGRVDRIVLRPGAPVQPDSIILHLANPEVEQAAANADSQLKAAEAELLNLRVTLQSNLLQTESNTANARADYEQTKLRAEVNEQLFKEGLLPDLDRKLSRVTADQAENRYAIEQKRLAFAKETIEPQLAVKQAEVDRFRAQAKLRRDELDALVVRAGMNGVLQILPVDVGQQVQPGTNLARVADPTRLKAEIAVSETRARDIQIGQLALIDTRNGDRGVIEGRVSRIDPSVRNGTVTVDVTLPAELPRGARPDLSVDGQIELERLADVIYMSRPAFGQEGSTIGIFKANGDRMTATEAARVQVKLGRMSVNFVEVVSGLSPGDHVILSDTTQWDSSDRLKLN